MDIDPYTHSIYCGLSTTRSLGWIAHSLAKLGWQTRMCSWTEHEMTCDVADLVLMPHDPPLLSGGIMPTTEALERVVGDLRTIGVGGDFELYDENNDLKCPLTAIQHCPLRDGILSMLTRPYQQRKHFDSPTMHWRN